MAGGVGDGRNGRTDRLYMSCRGSVHAGVTLVNWSGRAACRLSASRGGQRWRGLRQGAASALQPLQFGHQPWLGISRPEGIHAAPGTAPSAVHPEDQNWRSRCWRSAPLGSARLIVGAVPQAPAAPAVPARRGRWPPSAALRPPVPRDRLRPRASAPADPARLGVAEPADHGTNEEAAEALRCAWIAALTRAQSSFSASLLVAWLIASACRKRSEAQR